MKNKNQNLKEFLSISTTIFTLTILAGALLFYRAPQEFSPKAQASEPMYDILSGTEGEIDITKLMQVKKPAQPATERIKGVIREITAYNAGDPGQTDDSPCIGAAGTDICKALAQGEKICAANFVKLGTTLHIAGYGDCLVQDRMNSRYKNRVDIAMPLINKAEALKWGMKLISVEVKL